MGALISKPGLTAAKVLSIPKDWNAAWFRGLVQNMLQGGDVRNAVGANGISVTGNIASPYATIGFAGPMTLPGPVTVNGTLTVNGGVTITGTTITGKGANSGTQVDMAPDSGTFTGTVTGCTAGVTGTMRWFKIGNLVTIYSPGGMTGTSNTTAMTMTGLPAVIQPVNAQLVVCSVEDNGSNVSTAVQVNSSGTLTFYRSVVSGTAVTYSATGFTNSGTKGLNITQFTYALT